MTGLSLLFHAALILLGSTVSALFPQVAVPPVVIVEILDAPMSTLPEDEPPPPSPVIRETVASPSPQPVPLPPAAARLSPAEQRLQQLDDGLAKVPEGTET